MTDKQMQLQVETQGKPIISNLLRLSIVPQHGNDSLPKLNPAYRSRLMLVCYAYLTYPYHIQCGMVDNSMVSVEWYGMVC